MATNAFKSITYYHHNSIDNNYYYPSSINTKHTFFLKPTHPTTPTPTLSHSTIFAVSSTTPTSTPTTTPTPTIPSPATLQNLSFDLLRHHLSLKNYQEADEETRRLIILLAGEQAQKRGYVFFSEVQFISQEDLKTIDALWRQHSDGKFGYSVQKKIWKKVNGDFTNFFIRVGWMKKLESSEVDQYNYRAFPAEFMWEMEEGTPLGHLPLTNALRGTQLLTCILSHPAFDNDEEEEENESVLLSGSSSNGDSSKPLSERTFKPNYTF